jgi:hypothetical protein
MAEVTYFVALPFVAADDGIAPANQPSASIRPRSSCARKLCRANPVMSAPWPSAERAIRPPAILAMHRSSRNSARCRTISVRCSRQIKFAVGTGRRGTQDRAYL